MFAGHYGAAFAAQAIAPRLPLAWAFLGAQALDFLFCALVLSGHERLRIVPGFTPSNPYLLEFMPHSHGLLAAGLWSLAAGALVAWAWGGRLGLAAAFLVGSHWLLDWPVHTPDLPLNWATDAPRFGLGLWRQPPWAIAAEWASLGLGLALWWRFARPQGRRLLAGLTLGAALAALALASPWLPAPTGPSAFVAQALAAYLLLAGLAWASEGPAPAHPALKPIPGDPHDP